MKKILLTAIGKRVQLIKHLRKNNIVVGVDAGKLAPAQYFVNTFYQVPKCDEKGYIDALLRICLKERVDLLIPLWEKEFLKLDQHREEFEGLGAKLILSKKSFLEICNDKWQTYKYFQDMGLDIPQTVLMEELLKNPALGIKYPLILKPRFGMGSKGICHAEDFQELENLGLSPGDYIAQEFIEGTEFTVDVLCDFEGTAISIVPRRRIEIRDGEVSKSKTVRDFAIINKVLDLINKTKMLDHGHRIIGPINIQCIANGNKIKFIEINPRFGGGVPLTFAAGVNYGELLADMAAGEKINPLIGDFEELTMLRFDDAVYVKDGVLKENI